MRDSRTLLLVAATLAAGTTYLFACSGDEDSSSLNDDARDSGRRDTGSTVDEDPFDSGTVVPDFDAGVVPTAACDLAQAFGAPVALGAINGASIDSAARLSADELTITWSRVEGKSDIYTATRASKDQDFSNFIKDPSINSADNDEFLTITADGLRGYFSSDRPTSKLRDIWTASRATPTGAWENIALVSLLQTTAAAVDSTKITDNYPYVLPSGTVLYYSTDRVAPTADDFDIFRVVVDTTGTATELKGVGAPINLDDDDEAPVVSADELTMFFSRQPKANPRPTARDIYMTTRLTSADPWGEPVVQTALNTNQDERPTWLSPDGCRLYIVSNRTGSMGDNADLYVAKRPLL